MPVYEYVAKDSAGRSFRGNLEAGDKQAAMAKLHSDNLTIISISEAASGHRRFKFGKNKVKMDDLVVFSRQLATMVDAGIPILGSLDILSQQSESIVLKEVLTKVRNDVEVGFSLSNAFAKHPTVFSDLYISMVRAGESSGMLDDILDRLATYLEKTSALQKKIKSALVYPGVVTFMAMAITVLLLYKVIPVFKDIFSGFGAKLPVPTLVLIAVSDIFRKYFPVVIAVLVVLGVLAKRHLNTKKGRFQFDQLILKLPVFGMLFKKVAVSKFSRTLSTLVKSGVPILSSLEVVGKTCGNMVFEAAIEKVRLGVREGESIALPLEKNKVFPPMVVKMIAVGEQTGELEKMLSKVADFYDEQVDTAVSGLTSLIEPLIIAFLGIVIGGIVICMFMPIFKLSSIINV
jgi:type IV pilus assembly protein PilC